MCPEPRLYDETESKSAAGTNVSGEAASETTASGLLDSARSALAHNPLLPADKIRVVVRNAWLILEGEVQAHVQRQAAEDAVKDLPGLRGVSNNIVIESDVVAQRVSQKIDEAFIRNARLDASRISVTATDRKIILSGPVRSEVEREQAETAAWTVEGVAHVINRLRTVG